MQARNTNNIDQLHAKIICIDILSTVLRLKVIQYVVHGNGSILHRGLFLRKSKKTENKN